MTLDLNRVLDAYEQQIRRVLTKAACETYFYWAKDFCRWLTRSTISITSTSLLREYAQNKLDDEVSPTTLRSVIPAVRRFLDFVREGGCPVPAAQLPVELPRTYTAPQYTPTEIELRRFMDEAVRYVEPYATAIQILPATGVRDSELVSLTLSSGRTLPDGRVVFRVKGKGGKEREVVMLNEAKSALVRYTLRVRPTFQRAKESDWLFPVPGRVSHISRKSMEAHVRQLRELADVPRMTCHALRRYFVTGRRRAGMDESEIAKIIGHENLALFMRYYAPTAEDLSAAMSKSEAREARS